MSHAFGYGSNQKENQRWILEREKLPGYSHELDEYVVSTEEHPTDESWLLSEEGRNSTSIQGRNSAQSVRSSGVHRKHEHSGSLTLENPMSSHLHRSSVIKPLPLEWYTFRINSTMVGFDLELWWRRSPLATRIAVFVALFLVVIAFINLVAGIAFITMGLVKRQGRDNPYVCQTHECHEAAKWMTQTMNMSVKPCDNFYEFVCGNTEESSDVEDSFFKRYINTPGYKIEFGANSILAKILRNYKENDADYNQPIQFYQACLNERNRQKHGISAFREVIEYALETKDVRTFEKSSVKIEEVGAKMFRVMGHAVFLTFGFYPYPYIQRTLPLKWLGIIIQDPHAEQPVTKIVEHLLPVLGYPKNLTLIKEFSQGINVVGQIVDQIVGIYINFSPPEFDFALNEYLLKTGFCPPFVCYVNAAFMSENHN
ncbi:unnamed protein product [Orchesella dallaii]|uniref:Peptidase M13 N-terminal domain-containing protein n=1 Tax=Orchesella dallaii TaxID=48710 RepID=A0ABP1PQ44_9HEXA